MRADPGVVIERLVRHAETIRNGEHETVRPGQPFEFTGAAQPGDGVWQGDLGIEVVASVPAGYTKVQAVSEEHRKLVPGNTVGASHILDSVEGVEMWHPSGGLREESLAGPVFKAWAKRTVTHPVHGHVTIPEGLTVRCRYEREFDAEQRRERRAAD